MEQMSQALQSAQQSLQNAGQQSAQKKQDEASEEEMGQEPGQGGQSGQSGQGGQQGKSGQQGGQQAGQSGGGRGGRSKGAGLGGPGLGVGGSVGPQQPLPGVKKDELVRGSVNPKGEHLSRSYMGTPDPTKDRAAYYQVVPERVRAAEASLNREEIPAGHRDQVRKYFDSIRPSGK
jgi:hypothetical protein